MSLHDDGFARLSLYLDGELSARQAEAVEAHLAGCDACRTTVDDLARVRGRAEALGDRPPARDLWPEIRRALDGPAVIDLGERLGDAWRPPERSRRPAWGRTISLSLPRLAAAAAVIVVATAAGVWGVARSAGPGPGPSGGETAAEAPVGPAAPRADALGALGADAGDVAALRDLIPDPDGYSAAAAELEDALRTGRDRLGPRTVRVLESNLELIDGAIRESLAALASDPGNRFVEDHIRRSVERKVTYMREAAALLEQAP